MKRRNFLQSIAAAFGAAGTVKVLGGEKAEVVEAATLPQENPWASSGNGVASSSIMAPRSFNERIDLAAKRGDKPIPSDRSEWDIRWIDGKDHWVDMRGPWVYGEVAPLDR